MAKDSKVIKNVPVRYGKIGEVDGGGFKVPITVNASEVSFTEVRNTLISAECDVVLTCDPEGKNDDPKQSKMIETDLKVTAAGKIGRVSVSHENFRFALRCDIDDVDLNEIAKFGNRTGKATFRKTGNAADVARTESDDVEGEGALVQADKERS